VTHYAAPDFWACYRRLPSEVQRLADKSFEFLKADPHHPSIHFKKVDRFRSARVGLHHRPLESKFLTVLWFWIGTHAEYDSIIG
jgi:hypothetical protein